MYDPEELLTEIQSRDYVRGVAGQAEIGANGTPHLQFVVRFYEKKALRFLTANFPGCHCIYPKGTFKQNLQYCTKEDTREAGPWILGDCADARELGCSGEILEAAANKLGTHGARATAEEYPVAWIKHARGLRDHDLTLHPPEPRGEIMKELRRLRDDVNDLMSLMRI